MPHTGVAPQAMVLLHLAAMFGPALLLRQSIARWSLRTLSIVCTILLASGAALVTWAAAPLDLLGLAVTHGAAWGVAWAGQLWAPARRGQQGTSPLLAAAGYALVTLASGWLSSKRAREGWLRCTWPWDSARSRPGWSGQHPRSGFGAARLAGMPQPCRRRATAAPAGETPGARSRRHCCEPTRDECERTASRSKGRALGTTNPAVSLLQR